VRRPLRRVVARALGVSVRVKIMGIALGLVLLLGVGAVLQLQRVSRATLTRELDERAVSIARDTAVRASDFILLEDLVSLRDLVLDTMAASKDVRYIFVLDARANVLAHTFGHFLPPDLQPANSGGEYAGGFRIQRLASEEGILRDVAVPIFGGRVWTTISTAWRYSRSFSSSSSAACSAGIGFTIAMERLLPVSCEGRG